MEPARRASALSPAFAGTGELAAPELFDPQSWTTVHWKE
jgi:hypothetical protein